MNISIVLATYNPNINFLRQQLESIRKQSHEAWQCHLVDDNSPSESQKQIKALLEEIGDERFQWHAHSEQKNVFHNFERGLAYCQPQADYICLCDQDDVWDLNKLEVLLGYAKKYPEIDLFHSDGRVVNENNDVLAPSLWQFEKRDIKNLDWLDLLLKNVVTGCTTLFKRDLIDFAAPFPSQESIEFHHDLWLSFNASLRGGVLSVPETLFSYRLHGSNVVGPEKRNLAGNFKKLWVKKSLGSSRQFFLLRQKIVDQVVKKHGEQIFEKNQNSRMWKLYKGEVSLWPHFFSYLTKDSLKAVYLLQFFSGKRGVGA